jgi:hypothetical protein
VMGVGVKELAGLKHLQFLDLADAPLTDEGLKELAGLKQLKALDIAETRITRAALKQLKEALPNCEIHP